MSGHGIRITGQDECAHGHCKVKGFPRNAKEQLSRTPSTLKQEIRFYFGMPEYFPRL